MTFASPVWLWALALLLLPLLLQLWGSLEGRDSLGRLVSPRLRADLVHGHRGRSGRWFRPALLGLGFVGVVLALARPQWGEITQEEYGEGRSLMLAIDTSRSMLADDLKPDRMTRAKLAALDLIRSLPSDQIGLMAFAGQAFVQVPLTTDRDALKDGIEQLDIYSISRGGTNLGSAIKLASDAFEDAGTEAHALVLFTDGEELEGGALREAQAAAKAGTTIICIGVGSAEGSRIPDPDARPPGSSFVKDEDGKDVITKLDTSALETIANATDGLFLHLDPNTISGGLLAEALAKLDTARTEGGTRTIPIERFAWPLGFGLLALLIAVMGRLFPAPGRPPATASALLVTLLAIACPNPAAAGLSADALAAYRDDDFSAASQKFASAIEEAGGGERAARLKLGLGASALGAGEFGDALDAFGGALLSDRVETQQDAHYNLGATLYRLGDSRITPSPDAGGDPAAPAPLDPAAASETLADWRGAIDHYQSSLDLNPELVEAEENIAFIESRIDELEQQLQQQQQQQQQDQEQQEQEPEQQEEQSGEGSQQEQSPEEDEEGEQGEENQATEQEGSPPQESEEGKKDDGGEEEGGQTGEGTDPGEDEGAESEGTQAGEGEEPLEIGEPSAEAPEAAQAQVNERTGYTEEQARRVLQALASDEKPLKRPKRRARAKTYKDW